MVRHSWAQSGSKAGLGVEMTMKILRIRQISIWARCSCATGSKMRREAIEGDASSAPDSGNELDPQKHQSASHAPHVAATTRIYAAWPEEQWTVDGAAVDVSSLIETPASGAPVTLWPKWLKRRNSDAPDHGWT